MKTYHFCVIARRARFFAPDAAIFKPKVWHPGTKFGETARSGMRPTCTPSPCTSCLVFPYKTAGRSKQIRLLLPFLPPDGVSAQPPCSAAFQRSCVLHRAFSYDPSACSADRIPARTKKCPSRTRKEKAAARKAANELLRREFGASVFGLFAAYPMARIANAEKMCYNLS